MTTTRTEHDLLFCIARRDLDEGQRAELHRLLSLPVDWNYLRSTATRHGLSQLLYRHLNSISNEGLAAHLAAIKLESIENCQEVLALLGRLTELLQTFNKQQLRVLVFKGPVLSEVAYGDNSLRRAGDVDVLIHRDDFKLAKELLEELQYEMVPALTPPQQDAHLKFHCEISFIRDNGFTVIDLHWSLSPSTFPFGLNIQEVFERSREMSIGGQCFRTFGLEDLILFQCMHGGKHYWSRLEWIASLAEIIKLEGIDWDQLIEHARLSRSLKMLALGLNLAAQHGGAQIPTAVFDRIDPLGSMRQLAVDTLATIFNERDSKISSAWAIKKNFQIMDRKRDVIASAVRVLVVPTLSDWQNLALPSSLQSLYYFYRPLRLLKSYAASLMRKLLHGSARRTQSQSVKEPITGGLID